jgi:hypothetical protein
MGGKKAPSSQSVTTGWKPALDGVENNYLPRAQNYSDNYGDGQGLYSGSILADQDPNIRRGQEMALRGGDVAGGLSDTANRAWQGFIDYDPNSVQNQASRDALRANASAQFNEVIRPGVEDLGTSSGQFGGNQQNLALGAATAPLSRAIADNEYGLMDADRERAMRAIGMTGEMQNNSLFSSQIVGDVGQQRQRRGQQERLDEIQQYEAPRRNSYQSALEVGGLYSPFVGASQTTQGTGTPGSAGAGGVVSGALGGAAVGASIPGAGFVGAAAGAVIGGLGALL